MRTIKYSTINLILLFCVNYTGEIVHDMFFHFNYEISFLERLIFPSILSFIFFLALISKRKGNILYLPTLVLIVNIIIISGLTDYDFETASLLNELIFSFTKLLSYVATNDFIFILIHTIVVSLYLLIIEYCSIWIGKKIKILGG